MAPGPGFEPATSKLTASCSTAELSRISRGEISPQYKVLASNKFEALTRDDYNHLSARGQTDTLAFTDVYKSGILRYIESKGDVC